MYIWNRDLGAPFNFSETVSCRFQPEVPSEESQSFITDSGIWWSPHMVSCQCPDIAMQVVQVSVSFDSVSYSNALPFHIVATPSVIDFGPIHNVYPSQYIQFTVSGYNFMENEEWKGMDAYHWNVAICRFRNSVSGDIRVSEAVVIDEYTMTCWKPYFEDTVDAHYNVGITFDGMSFYEAEGVYLEISERYSPPTVLALDMQFGDDVSGRTVDVTGL